ncbi:GGDEF domain-containing protein [Paraburkholderia acidisoli]|uniref:diguanylate cyclase n=1 Tax=Paraburkholderia acidisoli TaxID=2571748 RepID=A0A7Z2GP13_9BURK|nr:GGDEF domain-containing protein [Paraburkholderia acidisoli]QGZ65327.1 diguanylate cyclase [Paraburkholderia acidisoli]
MHVDLPTLYLLAIGTLLASAFMTLWEHRTHPRRSAVLKTLALAYTTLALGCVLATTRTALPGMLGPALCNVVIVVGYLLILDGVAALNGRGYRALSVVVVVALALTWAIGGMSWQAAMWNYGSSVPITIISLITAREFAKGDGMAHAQSRHIGVIVTGIHAAFYAFRAFLLPALAARYGHDMLMAAGKATMYEGVLYSVVLPMTLLRLVREETHGQLLRESQTDYLTRLGNRRWFFEEGARLIASGYAYRPVSLLAFDLDHFKAINDRHGHKTGDEVLKAFAEVAREVTGPETIIARIGGEEFAALLCGQHSVRAREVGETIAVRFAQSVSERASGLPIHATVSIGLAQSSDESAPPNLADLLAAADKALYRAKSLGGNRLELAPVSERTAAA